MTDLMLKTQTRLRTVKVPSNILSIQAFLTYRCGFDCIDCTNNLVARKTPRIELSGRQWVEGLSRIDGNTPVTLRGGEPSEHPGFFEIMEALPAHVPVKLVTNLHFDVAELIGRVSPERMNAHPSWAPIRAIFHLGKSDPDDFLKKVMLLEEGGYRVGVLAMARPGREAELRQRQRWFLNWGVDFRIRPFVGYINGKLVGNFRYPDATGQCDTRQAACRSTELMIAPDGRIYHCRRDCFGENRALGHLLDNDLTITARHSPCANFGVCHPCDVELRPTIFGGNQRTAVEILPLD